jgi:hypothetical protein
MIDGELQRALQGAWEGAPAGDDVASYAHAVVWGDGSTYPSDLQTLRHDVFEERWKNVREQKGSSQRSVGHEGRPGRGGHRPPWASIARPMSASTERNPNARRMISRSLVFMLSTRAFDSPWMTAA